MAALSVHDNLAASFSYPAIVELTNVEERRPKPQELAYSLSYHPRKCWHRVKPMVYTARRYLPSSAYRSTATNVPTATATMRAICK
jgi:hypothetical protein